ncbi:MAG: type II toxin-antitoxin system HicB family antitoxin [Chloracidobacterium sp.]|nr:type II toxin-antitoxin system HicB family antitoxin [Chloracidobacterium sp.]MDW8216903.1 type II toxin-antitoxin system HicB family antitoxin [Acidobacteriota bacterium]
MALADMTAGMITCWSDNDQSFIIEVTEVLGCMADGQTYQEAVANAGIIIQDWIETAKSLGRPIPEPKGKQMYAGNA